MNVVKLNYIKTAAKLEHYFAKSNRCWVHKLCFNGRDALRIHTDLAKSIKRYYINKELIKEVSYKKLKG